MLFRKVWMYGWCSLVAISIMGLWDVSETTCGSKIPILLSRALTTDPWRGYILVFCLFAFASSFYLNSILMFASFLGFFAAFLVSMFQTNAHNALITVSSLGVLYECKPPSTGSSLWRLHWWVTILLGGVFVCWLIYADFGCTTLLCVECSWWYISEYLFFWSMFLLVRWRIPANEQIKDDIRFVVVEVEEATGEKETTREKKKLLF